MTSLGKVTEDRCESVRKEMYETGSSDRRGATTERPDDWTPDEEQVERALERLQRSKRERERERRESRSGRRKENQLCNQCPNVDFSSQSNRCDQCSLFFEVFWVFQQKNNFNNRKTNESTKNSKKMIEKSLITSFIILASAGCIKATTLGMKLFVLACAGLAGMYMVHLLAQDYNKYQTLNRPGRSLDAVRRYHNNVTSESPVDFFAAEESADNGNLSEDIRRTEEKYKRNNLLSLDRILRFDPTGCARRYVCTVATKATKKLTQTEKNIIQMLRSLPRKSKDSGQEAFRAAVELGRRKKDADACAEEYPKCFLSLSQMFKLVGFL